MSLSKLKSNVIAGNLLVVSSGFYLTRIGISPIYFFMICSFLFLLISLVNRGTLYVNSSMLLPCAYILYLALSQFLLGADLNTVLNVIMSVIYFLLTLAIVYRIDTAKILKISLTFIRYSIPLLILESLYRITNPIYVLDSGFDYRTDESLIIYPYKFNSIMYQDSNFVAIFILCLIFFGLYLIRNFKLTLKPELIILIILLFLTISRATILVTLTFILLFHYWGRISFLLKISLFIMLGSAFSYVLYLVSADGSFQSKFQIIDLFLDFLRTSKPDELAFGIGFGNTKHLFGIGAHNFFVTHIVESGFVGFTLLFMTWLGILINSNFKTIGIMLPFLVVGMSFVGHAIPYVYCIFALILILESRRVRTVIRSENYDHVIRRKKNESKIF